MPKRRNTRSHRNGYDDIGMLLLLFFYYYYFYLPPDVSYYVRWNTHTHTWFVFDMQLKNIHQCERRTRRGQVWTNTKGTWRATYAQSVHASLVLSVATVTRRGNLLPSVHRRRPVRVARSGGEKGCQVFWHNTVENRVSLPCSDVVYNTW